MISMSSITQIQRSKTWAAKRLRLVVWKGIWGGVTEVSHRYAKANNKYIKKIYNSMEESSFLQYLDASILYE